MENAKTGGILYEDIMRREINPFNYTEIIEVIMDRFICAIMIRS